MFRVVKLRRPAAALVALGLAGPACGDSTGEEASTAASGGSGSGTTATGSGGQAPIGDVEVLTPSAAPLPGQAACEVRITTNIPIVDAKHLDVCTDVIYPTNPPAGGDHWPAWASFATYEEPVPEEMLVHDLEHGAIAMLHDCDGCADQVLAAFDDAKIAHGADPKCLSSGTVARFIVAPRPELDHPVALAAWGATYTATCIDPPSLEAFVEAHYAGGPEDTCFPGKDPDEIACD
jgi:hypothetical protein